MPTPPNALTSTPSSCPSPPALSHAELQALLSPYDLKRLDLYSRNMADHHLITDLLPACEGGGGGGEGKEGGREGLTEGRWREEGADWLMYWYSVYVHVHCILWSNGVLHVHPARGSSFFLSRKKGVVFRRSCLLCLVSLNEFTCTCACSYVT